MKIKLASIFVLSTIALIAGISVAYYNTSVYGFDKNATVVSADSDKIKVFDFEIKYNDINNYIYNTINNSTKYLPKKHLIY